MSFNCVSKLIVYIKSVGFFLNSEARLFSGHNRGSGMLVA